MTSPSKKFKTHDIIPLSPETSQFSIEFPEDIIFMNILPLLSYKSLSIFKCVSRTWYKNISNSFSGGIVFSQCHGNEVRFFNTFDSPIGFDRCNHPLFTNVKVQCRRILASSCGLLCILFHEKGDITSFYVYVGNLATGVGEVIPLPYQTGEYTVGLAFDPLLEPNCYQLVQPKYQPKLLQNEYGFDVYSTKLCEWVRSKQRIGGIRSSYRHRKPITLKNIIYWDCYEYIISFDPWKDVAGYIKLPNHNLSFYTQELGTCNERITCTRMDSESLEVYVLLDESEKIWETKHKVSLDMMLNSNQDVLLGFGHALGHLPRRFFERLFMLYDVFPFPYEGGNKLFFRVSIFRKSETVFSYDLKLEKVSKFCEFKVMDGHPFIPYHHYDHADRFYRTYQRVFSYQSSMVKVPACEASIKCQKIFW